MSTITFIIFVLYLLFSNYGKESFVSTQKHFLSSLTKNLAAPQSTRYIQNFSQNEKFTRSKCTPTILINVIDVCLGNCISCAHCLPWWSTMMLRTVAGRKWTPSSGWPSSTPENCLTSTESLLPTGRQLQCKSTKSQLVYEKYRNRFRISSSGAQTRKWIPTSIWGPWQPWSPSAVW